MARVSSDLPTESVVRRAADFVFGYDFFISYSHRDGIHYPRCLKQQLEQAGFTVFLDETEYVVGVDLMRETRRQVQKSRKIVVVGRAAALDSEWVKREVEVALAAGNTPIIININGSLYNAAEDAGIADISLREHWL